MNIELKMSQPFDPFVQFDIWDALDEDSLRLTQTSEFWTQVQYEADRLDLVPPANNSDPLQDSDEDWRIIETPEEPHKENIVNHDCMWAGAWVDSVTSGNTFVPTDPTNTPTTPGQSLLRRDNNKKSSSRPETPPSLDGDPPQFRHSVDVAGTALRLLRDSAVVAADHSYTLARRQYDALGIQTPSDSCESDGGDGVPFPLSPDHGLNPGRSQEIAANNRRFEDTTVLRPSGVDLRGALHRVQPETDESSEDQRQSEEEEIDVVSVGTQLPLPTTPTHVRTESLPRVPSAQERQHIQRTVETAITPRSPRPAARKRLVPPPSIAASSRRRARGPGRRGRRSNTDTDSEAESPEIERRSIHNDMERLRRIGLKNLFDELKKQIPATRDKERAPKVVILREAAVLCRKLNQEDLERDKLKKKQHQLVTKLKKLRTMLSARYRSY